MSAVCHFCRSEIGGFEGMPLVSVSSHAMHDCCVRPIDGEIEYFKRMLGRGVRCCTCYTKYESQTQAREQASSLIHKGRRL